MNTAPKRLTERLFILVSPEEKTDLQAKAAQLRISVNELVRRRIFEEGRSPSDPLPASHADLEALDGRVSILESAVFTLLHTNKESSS